MASTSKTYTANIMVYIYATASLTTAYGNQIAYFGKGNKFNASNVSNSDWYQITSGTYQGKYVHLEHIGDNYNFDDGTFGAHGSDDEGGGSGSGSGSGSGEAGNKLVYTLIINVPILYVYKTPTASTANTVGTAKGGTVFTATLHSGSSTSESLADGSWFKVTSAGTFNGKYVQYKAVAAGSANGTFSIRATQKKNAVVHTMIVNTSLIYCYSKPNVSSANRAGTIKKDETFKATKYTDIENENILSGLSWFKITEGKYKGNYVQYEYNGAGGNFLVKFTDNNTTEATTTEKDGEERPTSVDADGNEVTDSEYADLFPQGMDEAFMTEYTPYVDSAAYFKNISEGLTINDIRGVLGIPHQFLPSTDMRLTGSSNNKDSSALGRVYTDKILRYMPLLLITPGIPAFMSGFNDDQKTTMLGSLLAPIVEASGLAAAEADDYFGKYYSLKYAYVDYFKYVNAMLRSASLFLGIDNVVINGKQLGNFNWLYDGAAGSDTDNTINVSGNFGKFLGPYVGCIALYADCGNSVSDSFSNTTTQSQLAGAMGSLSDTGREINFLVGNVGSLTGLRLNALTGQEDLESNMEAMMEAVNKELPGSNVITNILNKAQTILAGGRLLFPEIWSDSSFGRSYSCNMKLVSPSGDKLSIYLNILVPIYHLLGMCLPRQSIQQSYFSPFLLRCYYKGLFNVDMGIMTGLTITKGAEAEWSYDGIPTVADVSFEIKDLYDGMFMSRAEDERHLGILSNITELDYIANSCGININDQEAFRTLKLWKLLRLENAPGDFVYNNIFGNMIQFFNQKMQDIFGAF